MHETNSPAGCQNDTKPSNFHLAPQHACFCNAPLLSAQAEMFSIDMKNGGLCVKTFKNTTPHENGVFISMMEDREKRL